MAAWRGIFLDDVLLWPLAYWEAQMRNTDVVIVGGGLGGSLAAAMLCRAGVDAVLIDPHPVYPPDFRCEKLDATQLQTLGLTGLADAVVSESSPYKETWAARFGYLVEKRPESARGIRYDTLVNTVRTCVPAGSGPVHAKVTDISTGPDRQTVKVSNGESVSARLVILATGLNIGLRHKLNIEHETVSVNHSISIGFDIQPADLNSFAFSSLTYFAERPSDRMAYITLFPIGAKMRVNLFGYRDLHDPWLGQFRNAPRETLYAMWPRLHKLLGNFTVSGRVQIRPVDLYVTKGFRQSGVVLVGDAFSTACPAAGTGALKVLVDVERLCNVHIPRWLATSGMDEKKIAAFYDDPIKRACEAMSLSKAFALRSFSTDTSPRWVALRWAKFLAHSCRGAARAVKTTLSDHNRGIRSSTSEAEKMLSPG
jgi:2-polyprenyl-6-methoxyphenol hydroxylase-like FAD-dependent oxidoreductase